MHTSLIDSIRGQRYNNQSNTKSVKNNSETGQQD